MRVLVTGAGGLLGREVVAAARAAGHEVVGAGRQDADVTDPGAVGRLLEEAFPDAVIHCAAYTAVDQAESEPELARAVNRDGTRHVAAASAAAGARFACVSTDYVFDGEKRTPYLPGDATGPLSTYGLTKLEGERVAAEEVPDALIVRTSWLYGASGGFVPAILRRAMVGEPLRVVDDQRGRPTWSRSAAAAILELMEKGATGVQHVADRGDCTWFELAEEALRLVGRVADVVAVSSSEFGARARRPAYSVLDTSSSERILGRALPTRRESLAAFLRDRVGGNVAVATEA